jgi:pyridoxine 4-dehydrogenase
VQISVKFGALRGPDGAWSGYDCRPQAVRNFVAYSLKRLGTDYIDIYRPARLDPAVPIEDTVGAIADLVKAGYVRHIGLSEVGADTLRRASSVHPISDLQIEYSMISRGIEGSAILPAARELGIGITAYGVLSRGLISGHWSAAPGREGFPQPGQSALPGREPGPNLALVERLRALAQELGVSVAQLAIAWVAAQGATSCRWSARAAATACRKRWAPSISRSGPKTWRAWKPSCRRMRLPARATTPARWPTSTAKWAKSA